MKKLDGKIDWTIAEDESAWQASQSVAQPESAPSTQRRRKLALATLTAALLLLIGGWFWPRSAPAKGTIQKLPGAAAPTTIQAEEHLTQTLESLGNSMRVNNIQRIGDRIMTQVTVQYPEDGKLRAYRETRFYEKSVSEWQRFPWQRIAPAPALLGPVKTLQIANFTILYHAVDANAIYEAVPKIEQLYATLRHDFGLPAVVPGVAYTIEVASSAQGANFYDYSQRKLTIYSPLLLSAPVEITPAILVEQATAYPLAHLLIHETIYQHDARWQYNFNRWYPLENALSLWELWQEGGPLASSHADLVHWLYKNGKSANSRQPLPDGYAQLCRTYRIWQLIPSDLSIPLACNEEDATIAPSNGYPALASTWPQPTGNPGMGAHLQQSPYATPITLETMIEYIVANYGRDKLPKLVEALGEHTTTVTLIPALFGVSRADFEAGWQAYLAQHY